MRLRFWRRKKIEAPKPSPEHDQEPMPTERLDKAEGIYDTVLARLTKNTRLTDDEAGRLLQKNKRE